MRFRTIFLLRLIASAVVIVLSFAPKLYTQSSGTSNPPAQKQGQGQSQQNPPDSGGAAGGPGGDVGPVIVPKKSTDDTPPPPPKPKPTPKDTPQFSLSVDTTLVTVPVSVLTKDGQFVTNLTKDNFKVSEDGVQQNITQFGKAEAPITAVVLVQFASNPYFWDFMIDSLKASYYFMQTLKKDDYVALVSYDMKPHIVQDFTQDKRALMAAVSQLRPETAQFSETNLYDALADTIDRLQNVEGRKYIILVGTGCDSFSKLTLDKALKVVKGAQNTTIYTISTGQMLRNYAEARNLMRYLPCAHGAMVMNSPMDEATTRTDFLQADNVMQNFAKLTGGKNYRPMFDGNYPEIYNDIGYQIRNQYVLAYRPSNAKQDGSYRKIKVELLDSSGKPTDTGADQKGKKTKLQIIAREGYTAKHEVE
jgi:VWFA-related protein